MRATSTIAALAASIPLVFGQAYKGFNVGANNPDGSCKSTADWQTAFNKLRGLPQQINTVRLYASSDCGTLTNAVPAAINTGTKILVGIWTEDQNHYNAEKQALLDAISAHGSDWILAISTGSEDLYRGDTSASTLAQQIYDVRGMVRQYGIQVPVGHVDTWTAWVNGANDAVTQACDFIGMDGYPYWQNSDIASAHDVFFQSYDNTVNHVNSVKNGVPVWVTETGWPTKGPSQGAAVASIPNAQKYWHSVACELFSRNIPTFWYAYSDPSDTPAFGVFARKGQALYDKKAC